MVDFAASRQYDDFLVEFMRIHFSDRRNCTMSSTNKLSRSVALIVMGVSALLLLPSMASAQQKGAPKKGEAKAAATPFMQAVAKAKETGQPLVVFGMSEGCHRCQGLKE